MIGRQKVLLLLLFFFAFQSVLAATTTPLGIQPDPTYQTGLQTIISANTGSGGIYTISYNWPMATNSLNASLGIAGTTFATKDNRHGWQQFVTSLSSTALIVQVNVYNNNDGISYLKVCYLVSYSVFLDIGYVNYTFSMRLVTQRGRWVWTTSGA